MSDRTVLIVGAGPASLYAAQKLVKHDITVVIVNRDIKPGGLAEFGIYPNKYKMKDGLRRVFNKILSHERVHYFGNIRVGADESADLTLEALAALGFDAVLVAVGAQGTKWLGLPNEDAESVFHAKDLVYHYNGLPPFSERTFAVGQRVCVVGLGNVALDIVHWLVCEHQCESVIAVARRGPAERAYTEKEMKIVSGALDVDAIETEFDRISDGLREVGQDPDALKDEVLAHVETELEVESDTRFTIRFLRSPSAIVVEDDTVVGLKCDVTRLVERPERMGVESTSETETIPCDTVVFAIGDSIEPGIGLPLDPESGRSFATCPDSFEESNERYMVYDPHREEPLWGTFVIGWARSASDGLVGKARKDAVTGCDEVLAYLNGEMERGPGEGPGSAAILAGVKALIETQVAEAVDYAGVKRLLAIEELRAEELGVPEYKIRSSKEMLDVVRGRS